jgi:hypothetical protein
VKLTRAFALGFFGVRWVKTHPTQYAQDHSMLLMKYARSCRN